MPYVFNPFTGSFDDTVPLQNGKVPASFLPSYVDDILEFANVAAFPATGETGKIYLALDTNITYRWGGSQYTATSIASLSSVGNVDTTTVPVQSGQPLVWNGSKWVNSPTKLAFSVTENIDVNYNSTVLQLNFDHPNATASSSIIDDSPLNNTFSGTGIITSTNPRAGTGALSGSINVVNPPASMDVGSNEAVTVECWVRGWSTEASNNNLFTYSYGSGTTQVYINGTNGRVYFKQGTSNAWGPTTVISPNEWNHIALTRQAGASAQWRLHVNGVASAVDTIGWSLVRSGGITIGNSFTVIDLFRHTKNVARYAGTTFTPPNAPFVKGNGYTPSTIDAFDDVNTSTVAPTNGQALVWNSTTSTWVPSTVATAAQGVLAENALPSTAIAPYTGSTRINNCIYVPQSTWETITNPITRTLYAVTASAEGGPVTFYYYPSSVSDPPAIGSTFLGGFYGGLWSETANGVATHILIVAPKSSGQTTDFWSAISTYGQGLTINGYSDWRVPNRNELDILYHELKPGTGTNNTSSGINANSVPKRDANRTASVPAQTSALSFRTGAAEAFDANSYWSTTGSTNGRWCIDFSSGAHQDLNLSQSRRARLIRKVAM